MRIFTLAFVGLAVSGCATVTRGTTNQVTVNSEPRGADATTSTGLHCPSTPCTWEISRKTEFAVTFTHPGYKAEQVQVNTRVAGSGVAGFAGNVLLGGIVGMGVDAATGSTLEHYPNPVFVTMQPLTAQPAARSSRSRKRVAPKPVAAPEAPQS